MTSDRHYTETLENWNQELSTIGIIDISQGPLNVPQALSSEDPVGSPFEMQYNLCTKMLLDHKKINSSGIRSSGFFSSPPRGLSLDRRF